jgi:hypothetical protein
MNHRILRHTWGDGDTEKLQEKVIRNLAKEVNVDKTLSGLFLLAKYIYLTMEKLKTILCNVR